MNEALTNKAEQYIPPKKWDEITTDEKIERLREIIKQLQNQLSRAQADIHYVRENFKKHSHTEKEIVVPFNEYNNTLNGIGLMGQSTESGFF